MKRDEFLSSFGQTALQPAAGATPEERAKAVRAGEVGARKRQQLADQHDDTRSWVTPNGYRLSDRVWLAGQLERDGIEKILRTGIADGASAEQIARELEQYAADPHKGGYPMRRLARTELTRAFGKGTIEAAKANPLVSGIAWKTSSGHKDSDQCDANEAGGPYLPSEVPRYPNHPHCRCVLIPVVETDVEKLKALARKHAGLDDPEPPDPAREVYDELQQSALGWDEDTIRAVTAYKSYGFGPINDTLRGTAANETVAVNDQQRPIEDVTRALDDGMAPVSKPFTTYRTMSGQPAREFARLQPGDVFTDPAYVSTSVDRDTRITSRPDLLLEIEVPAGTPALNPEVFGDDREQEVLLGRNQTFRVLEGGEVDGVPRLRLEVVPDAEPLRDRMPTDKELRERLTPDQLARLESLPTPENDQYWESLRRDPANRVPLVPERETRPAAEPGLTDTLTEGRRLDEAIERDNPEIFNAFRGTLRSDQAKGRLPAGDEREAFAEAWRRAVEDPQAASEGESRLARFLAEAILTDDLASLTSAYVPDTSTYRSKTTNEAGQPIDPTAIDPSEFKQAPPPVEEPSAQMSRDEVVADLESQGKDLAATLTSTERMVAKAYTESLYGELNGALRGVVEHSDETRVALDAMDAVMKRAPELPVPLSVFRGERRPHSELSIGSVFRDPAFVSTSMDEQYARDKFTAEGGVLFEIRLPEGQRVVPMDQFNENATTAERELLLPRDTAFKVVGSETVDGRQVVTLEVVSDATPTASQAPLPDDEPVPPKPKNNPLSDEEWGQLAGQWKAVDSRLTEQQRQDLKVYKGVSDDINEWLRKTETEKDAARKEPNKDYSYLDERVKSIDDALALPEARLPEPKTVYRGMSWKGKMPENIASLDAGSIFSTPQFLSTAVDRAEAEWFTDLNRDAQALFEIRLPEGQPALFMDPYGRNETELLLPRDTALKVVNSETVNGVKHLTLEVVADRPSQAPLSDDALTPDEQNEVQRYTTSTYRVLNEVLRDNEPTEPGGSIDRTIRTLDSAIEKSQIDEPTTVYRGVFESRQAEKVLGALRPGDVFRDEAYVSTSRQESVAQNFSQDGFLLEIDLPAGTKALDLGDPSLSGFAFQEEVLLPRGSTFRVLEVDGRRIRMEVVGDQAANQAPVETSRQLEMATDLPPTPTPEPPPTPTPEPAPSAEPSTPEDFARARLDLASRIPEIGQKAFKAENKALLALEKKTLGRNLNAGEVKEILDRQKAASSPPPGMPTAPVPQPPASPPPKDEPAPDLIELRRTSGVNVTMSGASSPEKAARVVKFVDEGVKLMKEKGVDLDGIDFRVVDRVPESASMIGGYVFDSKDDPSRNRTIELAAENEAWADYDGYLNKQMPKFFVSNREVGTVIHEVGHALHHRALETLDEVDKVMARDSLTDEQKMRVARTISRYASTSVSEFVAEVFVLKVLGKPVPPDLEALYNDVGGPKV